jgi:hypothetical protein
LADEQAAKIYGKANNHNDLFPTWIPGTQAALFHNDKQITKSIPAYIRDAKHTPEMWKYLIMRSKEATGQEKSWDSEIYKTIAWKHFGESFGKLSLGRFFFEIHQRPTSKCPQNSDTEQLNGWLMFCIQITMGNHDSHPHVLL